MTKGDAREWARRYVGRHPFLFYNFYRLKPSYRDLLVARRTQIVIEGFPRSGNTFAVVAFEQAQRESVRVAHHLHMPAQVIRAAQWSITDPLPDQEAHGRRTVLGYKGTRGSDPT